MQRSQLFGHRRSTGGAQSPDSSPAGVAPGPQHPHWNSVDLEMFHVKPPPNYSILNEARAALKEELGL